MNDWPLVKTVEVQFFERDVRLRLPFRFGIVTLTEAPQAFVRARVRFADGAEGWGTAAEMLAPKWFDKDPNLTNEENFDQLRRSLALARDRYLAEPSPQSAFGLHARCYPDHLRTCAEAGLNPLVASFGPALIDRAILDGLCRHAGISIFAATRRNAVGLTTALTPDLERFDIEALLRTLAPAPSIALRHTVGLVDAIREEDLPADRRVGDGLPETLEASIARYGLRYFKLKVGGDLPADLARLRAIAAVLDRLPEPYHCTLDGNEQYRSTATVLELVTALRRDPALRRLVSSILFLEQPLDRRVALSTELGELAEHLPVEIDESDATLSTFVEAKGLGYSGVSSKSCKGFYRSLLNRCRCAAWNAEEGGERYFMSAEDLTTQAGLAVQGDLALATLIGCRHIERNGHHYVNGMAGLPKEEQQAFLSAHPDLYTAEGGAVRLRVTEGELSLRSLDVPGLASGALPSFATMRPCTYADLTTRS